MGKFRSLNFYIIFCYYDLYDCPVLVANKLLKYVKILDPQKERERNFLMSHFSPSFKLKTRILTLSDSTQNLPLERN